MVTAVKVKGITMEAKYVNAYLDVLKHKVFVNQGELTFEDKEFKLNNFKGRLLTYCMLKRTVK